MILQDPITLNALFKTMKIIIHRGTHEIEGAFQIIILLRAGRVFRVFFPYWLCKRITQQGEQELMYRYKNYKITREEISDRSGEIMMMVKPSMLKDLELIKNIEGAIFIYSLWEGYLQDDSMQKMMKFVKKKNMKFCQVHTSGHAEIDTLKKA